MCSSFIEAVDRLLKMFVVVLSKAIMFSSFIEAVGPVVEDVDCCRLH